MRPIDNVCFIGRKPTEFTLFTARRSKERGADETKECLCGQRANGVRCAAAPWSKHHFGAHLRSQPGQRHDPWPLNAQSRRMESTPHP